MISLLALYPKSWRDRYEAEFRALLAERRLGARDRVDIVRGALDARLHPQVSSSRRPEEPAPASGIAAEAVLAILGGALWAASGLAFTSSRMDQSLGYKETGSAVLVAVGAALLTALASIAITRSVNGRSRRMRLAAIAQVVGAFALVLPWPIVALGFYTTIVGTMVFGVAVAGRVRLVGWALLIAAAMALEFNTEDERAFLLVPLGIAWVLIGARTARGIAEPGAVPPAANDRST